MTPIRKFTQAMLSLIVILSIALPLTQTQTVSAQEGDDLKKEFNSESGRVNFIGPASGKRSVSARTLGFTPSARPLSPAAAARRLAERFAPEFGVAHPERDLTEMKTNEQENGRVTVRYQQNYEGIPVIGGELIVNTDENGDLYSMNGEVAQDLALDTQPVISAEEAVELAKQGMVKWYGGESTDYQQTQASLWIFDEKLLRPSIRPAQLVWRLEVTSTKQPLRELVLINTRTGTISLHFNQIDTAWEGIQDAESTRTPTPQTSERSINILSNDYKLAFSGTNRYVATIGADSGTCTNSSSPCAHIQYAINQAVNGDIINVADGTYYYTTINADPNVVIINKGVLLSGGWQDNFSSQTGVSVIDGENLNNGILVTAADDTAVDRFVIQNSRSADSGAIYQYAGKLTLRNSTLKNNMATGRGAGIFVTNNATLTVINSTISNNTATSNGGGIYVGTGTVNIEYSTIAYNTSIAGTGGGISRTSSTVNMHNSILANNTASTSPDCNGLSTSNYNIIGSKTNCTFTTGSHDKINIDPRINSALTGIMPILNLMSDSPAVDAGESASCGANAENHDERGIARPQGSGCDIGAVEYTTSGGYISVFSGSNQQVSLGTLYPVNLSAIVRDNGDNPVSGVTVTFTAPGSGAGGNFANNETYTTAITDDSGIATASTFTANSTFGIFNVSATASGYDENANFQLKNLQVWYVSPIGNDNATCDSPSSPCLTIQQAITNATAGESINIQTGTYTSASSLGVVNIDTKSLTLAGGWNSDFTVQDSYSIIDGQTQRRGIKISASDAALGVVVLDNLVIQNGRARADGGYGGGVYVSNANLTINDSLIRDNNGVDNNDNAYQGAGIYSSNSHLMVKNSTISGNTAADVGGGIAFVTVYTNRTLLINNSTIVNNRAVSAAYGGGGIYIQAGITPSMNQVIRNSILANNTASIGPNCKTDSSFAVSVSYSIINDASGCWFNQIGVITSDPQLTSSPVGSPGHYAFLGNSPALNAGDPTTCLSTDQRGVARTYGSACDIGAFERATSTNPVSLFGIFSGDSQRNPPGFPLAIPLAVYALDSNGDAVSGLAVTFTAPTSGASGTFAGAEPPGNTATVTTDSAGIATSPTFTPNDIFGLYSISATASGVSPVFFQETNLVWYVSPTGPSSCSLSNPRCTTIQAAINNAGAGDPIWVEKGTYSENLTVSKNIILEGGWNSDFTIQDGQTVIDGENLRRNVSINSGVTASMDRFDITRGKVTNTNGGGILNNGALTFTNGAIYNNSVHHVLPTDPISNGGGIYSNGTQLTLTNATISNNEGDVGGGLYVASGNTTLNNVTITQNLATNLGVPANGGGIENANNSPVIVKNSIIAGNAAEVGQDCHNTITSGGNNLIGFNAGCDIAPAIGDRIGKQFEPLDAMLGDLGDNGSSTKTHALLAGGPAIDAGNPVTCATTDQRGVARPQGAACDIGAFEGSETQTVTGIVKTYTAEGTPKWPGRFLCNSTTLNCTGSSDPEADKAHRYALGTYNMYLTEHGRKGIDNNNMPVISTVHYCGTSGCPYDNATWSGAQILYGDGYANADDVVAHEYTHGVTQYESNLMYWYQSGAINESFSDLWGEYYDQHNGLGKDTAADRWKHGEDLPSGANRDMKNPPAYKDPDKMTSSLYIKGDKDSGGVHSNSGINNKAAYLIVDGGTFNGKTVTGIGWKKTITIYYEAQTNLLTSGSDYSDLYYALQQACLNVTGQEGITSSDCKQVKKALTAVEMNSQPVAGFNPDASICPTGKVTGPDITLFDDSFENGTGNWNIDGLWTLEEFYPSSGSHTMWGNDEAAYSNSSLTMANSIPVAASGTYLYFKHAFAFSYWSNGSDSEYYDGAVLEYSTNGGSTWKDAKPLFSAGQSYKGTIFMNPPVYQQYDSVLRGRAGFVGDSHGYVSSRYDLSSLTGKTVHFRWRFATNWDYSYWGWFVDDVKIYRCVGVPAIPTLEAPLNNANVTDFTPYLNWTDATPSLHHYQLQISTNSDFTGLVYDEDDLPTSEFTVPANLLPNTPYYWHVQAFNAIDATLGWSPTWTFHTALTPPVLTSPAAAENLLTRRPTLDWEDVLDSQLGKRARRRRTQRLGDGRQPTPGSTATQQAAPADLRQYVKPDTHPIFTLKHI